jgi:hypothetical protein
MYIRRHDTDLSLKFGIIGGIDNPSFKLSLRAGNVTRSPLPDHITIMPKNRYPVVQFPILPTINAELEDQMVREVKFSGKESFRDEKEWHHLDTN